MNEPLSIDATPPRPRGRRLVLWGALVALLVVAQSMLVFLTANYERVRAQDLVEAAATAAAADVRQALSRHQQSLQALQWNDPSTDHWRSEAAALLHSRRDLLRIERRDPRMHIAVAVDSPYQAPVFTRIAREAIELEAQLACAGALRLAAPAFSRSYFVPMSDGLGMEVVDLCVPLQRAGQPDGVVIATLALGRLLEESIGADMSRGHEFSFIEGDGTRLARAGARRGAGVFVAERVIDLPGQGLQLRVDSGSKDKGLVGSSAPQAVQTVWHRASAVAALPHQHPRNTGRHVRSQSRRYADIPPHSRHPCHESLGSTPEQQRSRRCASTHWRGIAAHRS